MFSIDATSNSGTAYVPTPAMLAGDFSGTGQTFKSGGTTLSPTTFDPAIVNITNLGFSTLIGTSGQEANGFVRFAYPGTTNNYSENTDRIDYIINPKERLFLRSYILYDKIGGSDVPGNLLAVNEGETGEDYNETLGLSSVINNTTANSLTLGYLQEDTLAVGNVQTSNGSSFCWSKYVNVTEPTGQCYLEAFDTSGFDSNWTEPTRSAEANGTLQLEGLLAAVDGDWPTAQARLTALAARSPAEFRNAVGVWLHVLAPRQPSGPAGWPCLSDPAHACPVALMRPQGGEGLSAHELYTQGRWEQLAALPRSTSDGSCRNCGGALRLPRPGSV